MSNSGLIRTDDDDDGNEKVYCATCTIIIVFALIFNISAFYF